ncbi:MAG: 1,6-anhydro-N-acetylmuramyl-L-alanine amidase AmpD [Pseudomonadota bacterium]|nr:1,6-anhydro-N-acetylmuramyl-L-alanine amidase AmpD [Pseudomonadota bacterium]
MNDFSIRNHWLENVRRVPSENHDERPAGSKPTLIVVHCISLPPGAFGGKDIDRLFQNRLDPKVHPDYVSISRLRVSAHALVRRTGEITQYVPFSMRAWHAGKSSFDGQPRCNDFSIGIELEGTDDSPFADVQYHQLAQIILSLIDQYPTLSRDRVAGHSDIAPGRKTDPGIQFNWERLFKLIAG